MFALLLLLSSCTNNDSVFFDKLLNDFERYSWFISVKINSFEYNGKAIIENDDLFYFLNQTQKLDREQYRKVIGEKLKNNGTLEIGQESLVKWNFIKVPDISSINQNAQKGVRKFVKIYFDGKVLKDGITDEERTAVIQKLFDWKIASKTDDESGCLILSRFP